ncbi:LacI family transcriptional regulator [Yoonia sp. I 8.24]|uniref:LacI family transcriptional regulator n=1 Tax=Yoonia sp. I 8.24 TaxID=1537229 RepID=UPI001EDFDB5E|nr:LacI family transcriptional regulator [Yoonia sp. I 8.24]MCG3268673.1 LacI family DNA-binding transcriptional regulator [Yoonia sp. I 8.24]
MSPKKAPTTTVAEARSATGKPTLKTIARISGLAVPTVSRALNDAPDIGAETKKLIRKIAKEVGYIPNRAGVRLRTGRTNVISLVMSTEHDMMSHTARLISSVAGGLRDTPFHLVVTPFFPDQDPMEPVRYIVETGSADAVIINQVQPQDPRIAYLMEKHFPFATHGRSDWAERHPYYDFDNSAFGELAVHELAGRGRKNVLLIAPPAAHAYAQHMIYGTRKGAAECGINVMLADPVTSDTQIDDIVDYVVTTLRTHPEIDAIMTASTSSAMAAVAGLEKTGAKVGREIDVSTKEAVPFLKLFRADILTTTEKVGAAGEFLARAAIQAIRSPLTTPMQHLEVPSAQDS